ncbi:MAG: sodium-dependent transporter [Spirochaetia bacterium]|nr:sodium-dependent transporter [Spirochaetia bacterium]
MSNKQPKRENWSGKLGFILAASGSAVGLGNLWKFPYITWENGGGLFVLIYLLCIFFIGLPIMIAEIGLGKITSRDPVGAFEVLGGKKTPFRFVGVLGVLSAFLILSFYSVVAGWSIEYSIKSISSDFKEIPIQKLSKLLEDEKNIKHAGKVAFQESMALPLSDAIKEQLLFDATNENSYLSLSSEELNKVFIQKKDDLSELLVKENKLEYWEKKFFNQKSKNKDFNIWINKILMPAYSSSLFGEFLSNSKKVVLWHLAIMIICLLIVGAGIKKGIEKTTKYLMPMLLFIMFVLMINSLMLDKEQEGIRFLLFGNPSKWNALSIPQAMGHAFFTLSLGMGAMLTYGSYMKKNSDIVSDAIWVTSMDTIIALLACMMIFPIIFVYGLEPTSGGIGILFTTLPLEFFKFSSGAFLSLLFYVLVFLAALTSAISLLEVVVTYLKDEWNFSRVKSVLIGSITIFLAGLPAALHIPFMDYPDTLSTTIMLPMGGFLIAIFTGYKVEKNIFKNEFLNNKYPLWSFNLFYFTIRYITPLAVLIVFSFLIFELFK